MEYRCGGIIFFSDFDSGNLGSVEKVENDEDITLDYMSTPDYEFNIKTNPDCAGTQYENGNRSWFYFGVRGYTAGKLIKINITNMNKQGKLYSQGMSPLVRTVPYKPKWDRIRDKPTQETIDEQFILSFTHRFINEGKNGMTYFAFCYPWSYAESQKQMAALDLKYKEVIPICSVEDEVSDDLTTPALSTRNRAIYYHRELACYTPEKRRVDLLTISSYENIIADEREPRIAGLFPDTKTPRCHKFKNKKIYFLSSRVHPGETVASHVYNGFLNFILDDKDARAKELRKRYVFKLIPMLNPDGVFHGHYRTDIYGVNLNRFYMEPDPIRHSPIFASRTLMLFYHLYYSDNVEIVNDITGNQSLAKLFTDVAVTSSKTRLAPPVAADNLEKHKTKENATKQEPIKESAEESQESSENTQQESQAAANDETTSIKNEQTAGDNDEKKDEKQKEGDATPPSEVKKKNAVKPTSWKELDYPQMPPRESGVHFYMDLHGHASKRGCFIYGNQIADLEHQVDNLLYPRLIALNTPHFDFHGCNFTEKNMYMKDKRDGLSKEGAGRVAMHKLTGITHSYTLECNYNTGRTVNCLPPASQDGGRATPPPPTGYPPRYTIDILEHMGKALSIAALDFHQCNPWSRLPNSEFTTYEELRQWTSRYVQSMRGGGSTIVLGCRTNRYARNHKQHALAAALENRNNPEASVSVTPLARRKYSASQDLSTGGGNSSSGASTRSERSSRTSTAVASASASNTNKSSRRDFIKRNKNLIKAAASNSSKAAASDSSVRQGYYNKQRQLAKTNKLSPLSSPETSKQSRRRRQRRQPLNPQNGGSTSDTELVRLEHQNVPTNKRKKGRSLSLNYKQYKLPNVLQELELPDRKFSLDSSSSGLAGTVPYRRRSPVSVAQLGLAPSPPLLLQPLQPPPQLIIATAITSASQQNAVSKLNLYDMKIQLPVSAAKSPKGRRVAKKNSPTPNNQLKKKHARNSAIKQNNPSKLATFTVPCTTR